MWSLRWKSLRRREKTTAAAAVVVYKHPDSSWPLLSTAADTRLRIDRPRVVFDEKSTRPVASWAPVEGVSLRRLWRKGMALGTGEEAGICVPRTVSAAAI